MAEQENHSNSKLNRQDIGVEFRANAMSASFEFFYPTIDGHAKYLEVGLTHVRAADNIRIHYDFARDGWAIEQPQSMLDADDPKWKEVAFIQAWGSSTDPENVTT